VAGTKGSRVKTSGALPRWLPTANRLVRALSRLGLRLGTIQVLTVPGRRSGMPRSTPVSPLTVGGRRYVIAGLPESDWARNVRAAGRGELGYGRRRTRVTITEVTDPAEKRTVVRAFPVEVPHGVAFFVQLGLVTAADPDQFAAITDRVAVFRLSATPD
jgi:deazaflavin-dependent oxidoreductase (nitroreductase family)